MSVLPALLPAVSGSRPACGSAGGLEGGVPPTQSWRGRMHSSAGFPQAAGTALPAHRGAGVEFRRLSQTSAKCSTLGWLHFRLLNLHFVLFAYLSTAETLHAVRAVGSCWLCFTCSCISRTRLHLCRSGENCRICRISAASKTKVDHFIFLLFCSVEVKATLLQLEVLESGIEERLSAPPAPCLSCADWFLPSATNRDGLASPSPVFTKLAGAVKGATASRGGALLGDRARRFSPHRSLSDSGSEGPGEAGSGSTPESPGGRRHPLGPDGSGGLLKVNLDSCRYRLLCLLFVLSLINLSSYF